MRVNAPKESAITAAIQKAIRARGWWCMKIHGGPAQMAGVPDLLVIVSGRAVWLEVKRPGKRPTPLQTHRLNELRNAGCTAAVVTSREEALKACEESKP